MNVSVITLISIFRLAMADFLRLPDELLLMIFNYCNATDYLQLSRVCRKFDKITCDYKLVKIVKFYHDTTVDKKLIKGFLTLRPRAQNISTIDLTSCYWLTSSFILNTISCLKQVENVLVADTALISKHLKQLLQTLPQLKRISWTWRDDMDVSGCKEAMKKLQFLYLCLHDLNCINLEDIVVWVNHCIELQELWIINDASRHIESDSSIELQHLGKLVLYPHLTFPTVKPSIKLKQICHSHSSILNLDRSQALLIESIFTFKWVDIFHVLQFGSPRIERVCCLDRHEPGPNIELLFKIQSLKALTIVLHPSIILPPDCLDWQGCNVQELSLETIHKFQDPSKLFCEFASSCPLLKRLSLPVQALVCDIYWLNSSFENEGCSSKRVSRVNDSLPDAVETPFRNMVLSTPLVEVFEIGVVGQFPDLSDYKMPLTLQWDFGSVTAIGKWKNLSSLTLAKLPIRNGKFLMQILTECKQLKILKLLNLGPRAVCVYSQDLFNALPNCKELQDFHWTQMNVGSTSKLWMALMRLNTLKRVALCLGGTSSLEMVNVHRTMEKCASLYFLYVGSAATKAKTDLIKKSLLSRWSPIRPHLIVWFGKSTDFLSEAKLCPKVHAAEMIQNFSKVRGVQAYGSQHLSFGTRVWAPYH